MKFSICGKEWIGLVDSGSHVTAIGEGMEEHFTKQGFKTLSYDKNPITSVDGTDQKIKGVMYLPYFFNDSTNVIGTIVLPSIKRNFILGVDFMEAFGLEVSLKNLESLEVDNIAVVEESLVISELSDEDIKKIEKVRSLFVETKEDNFGKTDLLKHYIDTGDARPIKQRQHRWSPYKLKLINEEVDRLLKLGIIQECEFSSWSNPIVPVIKNEKCRLCLDARKLNLVTKTDAMPIEDMSRIRESMPGARFLSKIDLSKSFHQIELTDESKPKTAFEIPGRGFFMFNVMPFGIKNAPSCLARLLRKVLKNMEPEVYVFVDDIIIRANTLDRMLELLEIVARALAKAKLTINGEKSELCKSELKYLGYIINQEGWSADPTKVESILNYAAPKSIKDIRRFMGMINFFRTFIPNLSEIAAPITELTKGVRGKIRKINWTVEAEAAFKLIKSLLISAPILAFPDFNLPFTIHVDASNFAAGAILTQVQESKERVICYFSKKFNTQQKRYSAVEREMLALFMAAEKFKGYIGGVKFNVITDCNAVTYLRSIKVDGNNRLSRWVMDLQKYDIEFQYRKGAMNVVPDALSRSIEELISTNDAILDPDYLDLFNRVISEPLKFSDYKIFDGKLFKYCPSKDPSTTDSRTHWKEVIPFYDITEVLYNNHDEMSHQGITKTLARIRQKYFFYKMYPIVRDYINNCESCKMAKAANYLNKPPMGAPKKANRPWEVLSFDFLGPFPRSYKGNTSALVVVCCFSKFVFIHPMPSQKSDKMIEFLDNQIFNTFGSCKQIICDNGKQMKSKVFMELIEKRGIELLSNAYYHSQTNPTERVNRVIGDSLRACLTGDQRVWDEYTGIIQAAINSSIHEATGKTPYFIVFGKEMIVTGKDYEHRAANEILNQTEGITETEVNHEILYNLVKNNIDKAFTNSKHRYNLRTRKPNWKIGDIAYKTNYILSNKGNYFSAKLAPKKVKARIVEITGSNTYRLEDMKGKNLGVYSAKDLFK